MKKLRAQLEQLGSKELSDSIMESLEKFKADTREEAQAEFAKRLEEAKKVCVEEVETYKSDLAKKVQLFLEAKNSRIEQQIARQSVVKESAAEAKLTEVSSILAGVEANGGSDEAELTAAKEEARALRVENKKLADHSKVLNEKATRAHGIAQKALDKNKTLAEDLDKARKQDESISEGKDKDKSKSKPKKKDKSKSRKETLSEGRSKQKPATTRSQSDSQVSKPKKTEPESAPQRLDQYYPSKIAASMD